MLQSLGGFLLAALPEVRPAADFAPYEGTCGGIGEKG
jgi:hypothetical protein